MVIIVLPNNTDWFKANWVFPLLTLSAAIHIKTFARFWNEQQQLERWT
jgi:hypothetical protein